VSIFDGFDLNQKVNPHTAAQGLATIFNSFKEMPKEDAGAAAVPEGDQHAAHPAEGAPITGSFGENRGDHAHGGIDFGVPSNTSILSMAGGTVSQVVMDGQGGGYGNFVIVDHGNGLSTRYAHLNSVGVQAGAKVKAGQPLGLSGSTGKSSGPHLHFEVMQNGAQVDPSPFLAGGGAIVGREGGEVPLEEIAQAAQAPAPTATEALLGDTSNIFTTPPREKEKAAQKTPGGAEAIGDDPAGWVRQAMKLTGVSDDWFEPLMARMKQESGGDPNAVNNWDSNAKTGTPSIGLFQTIDPTFQQYKNPGMDDIRNPVHNAVAAIKYMIARYGSVHNLPRGGY
jgi:hypothetical protein